MIVNQKIWKNSRLIVRESKKPSGKLFQKALPS